MRTFFSLARSYSWNEDLSADASPRSHHSQASYSKPAHKEHPHDVSVMRYRGHAVLRTLIRCNFSPVETTSQRYLYSGSSDGKIHVRFAPSISCRDPRGGGLTWSPLNYASRYITSTAESLASSIVPRLILSLTLRASTMTPRTWRCAPPRAHSRAATRLPCETFRGTRLSPR